ncbi:DUF4179 domain-containing protein [Bacillus sp. 2205SS5-2]|uniref:DUF4179 domain-containing protein n=1 Tax=Bacillus sp. 2205SS5-2 TaxID=3109031 RepID=UPI003006133E
MNRDQPEYERLQEEIESIKLPGVRLDDAVYDGFLKGKRKKKIKKFMYKFAPVVLAAALLCLIISSVRMSTSVAATVSSIPGFSQIVQLLREDKGMMALLNQEYLQPVIQERKLGDKKIYIDSYILDEEQMHIFLSFSEKTPNSSRLDSYLRLKSGEKVESFSSIMPVFSENDEEQDLSVIELYFKDNDIDPADIKGIGFTIHSDENESDVYFPLKVDTGKIGQTIKYEINQWVEIQGQNLVINQVIISPTQTEIKVEYDSTNSMRIFDLKNVRLVDQNGETWARKASGITSFGEGDEVVFVLQSNYFETPQSLSVAFDGIRGWDKDDLTVTVDLDQQKILHQPTGLDLKIDSNVMMDEEYMFFETIKKFNKTDIFSEVRKEEGRREPITRTSYRETGKSFYFGVPYDVIGKEGKVSLYLSDFPHVEEGDVLIPIE